MGKIEGVAVAILAGGDAVRMAGRNKSLLTVDGRRIVDRQLEVLRPLFDELFVVANEPAPYQELGLDVVPDLEPGQGPLMGLLSALQHTTRPRMFAVACDMPYLQAAAIRFLCELDGDWQASVPRIEQYVEPLFACYGRDAAAAAQEQLAAGDRKLANLTRRLRCRFVDGDELRALDDTLQFLQNCNTPQDLGSR